MQRPIQILQTLVSLKKDFVRIPLAVIDVLERIILVFFMNRTYQEHTISSALLVDIQRITYPSYSLSEDFLIFQSRNHLLDYEQALKLEFEMSQYIDLMEASRKKNLTPEFGKDQPFKSLEDYIQKINQLRKALNLQGRLIQDAAFTDPEVIHNSKSLAYFKARYSASSVHHRIIYKSIHYFESTLKIISFANTLIMELLTQFQYLLNKRGALWQRLIINCRHLKEDPELVKWYLDTSLKDPFVKKKFRYDLEKRSAALFKKSNISKAITTGKRRPKKELLKNGSLDSPLLIESYLDTDSDTDIKEMEITGSCSVQVDTVRATLSQKSAVGKKAIFHGDYSDATSVEQVAIEYFERKWKWSGKHVENSFFTTCFTLLFWDILFKKGGIFLTAYQSFPLDLFSDGYYERFQGDFDARLLELLQDISGKYRRELITVHYQRYFDCHVIGVAWDTFELDELLEIQNCFTSLQMTQVMRAFVQDYAGSKHGLPDLILWDSNVREEETKKESVIGKVVLVEVKSPRDRLSIDQILWMQYLTKECHIPVRLCKVSC